MELAIAAVHWRSVVAAVVVEAAADLHGRSLGLDGLLRREESAAGSKNWRIQVAKLVA